MRKFSIIFVFLENDCCRNPEMTILLQIRNNTIEIDERDTEHIFTIMYLDN